MGPREDMDVGVKRDEELPAWKERDPIRRLVDSLIKEEFLTSDEYQKIKQEISNEVSEAWAWAEKQEYPQASALLNLVYQNGG